MTTTGRTVGGYEIGRVLGRGGMATVYLARQIDLDRDIALKELTLADGRDPQLARRFLREARLAGSLSHPNIVTVHDFFESDGRPYIAMELLACGSLRPYVGRLSLAQAGGVLHGVLAGLAHAEERRIVHRDLKPENIMISSQGSVKIADFGIAKATSNATAGLTTTGTTLGTPRYMAPERAMGREIGPWTDLYSVGVIAFELLVGRTPFHDTEAPIAVLMRQINDPIPAVTSLVPDVDPALSSWIERLLVKDPAGRPGSAAAVSNDLDEILADLLGPRWIREAPLAAGPGAATIGTGAAARTRRGAGRSSSASRSGDDRRRVAGGPAARFGDATSRTTVPDDPALAATVAPATHRLSGARAAGGRGWRVPGLARLALVAAMLLAGVAALTASRDGEPRPAGRSTALTAGNGQVAVRAPAGWHEEQASSGVPLRLADAVTVARGGGSVTAGVLPGDAADGASLLPAALLRSLGLGRGEVPPRTRAVVGGFEGWRYAGLRPQGSDAPLTVYAARTAAGVASVACTPPAGGGDGFARACASVARTLRIADAHAKDPSRHNGVGDSRSDDPSDDEPDEEDNGD